MVQLKLRGWWLCPLGIVLGHAAAVAQVPLRDPLRTALCLNDWNQAIVLLGPMISAEDITPGRRRALVDYRQHLVSLRDQQRRVDGQPGCEEILAQYVTDPPEQPSPPLDWEAAIASTYGIGSTAPALPTQAFRRQRAERAAGMLVPQETEVESLSPFYPLNVTRGSAVSAGGVSGGYQVYSFLGGQGDVVNIQVRVTEVYSGSLYTDDDSQLFLFDSQGTLLSENDDFVGLQSNISNFALPRTDRYYVAVTTYNNDPVLDSDRRITGWTGNGGSDIDFTISVTGLTPTSQLVLPR